jgi:hypothetical protein
LGLRHFFPLEGRRAADIPSEKWKKINGCNIYLQGEPGSSVSIVSGYGLDDRAIEVRSSAEAKGFFL